MRFGNTVRSEVAKTFSLRVPLLAAVFTALAVNVLSGALALMAQRAVAAGRPEDVAGIEPSSAIVVVLHYGQVGVVLFGCWLVVQEQERGNLRTSLLATPARPRLFAAKACVAAVGSFAIASVAVLGSWGLRGALVGPTPLTASVVGDVRVLFGYIAYWTLLGVLAFALTVVMRSGIVALATLLMMVLALSAYLRMVTPLARFLPDQAGAQMYQEFPPSGSDLGPVFGFAVLGAWVVAALAIGAFSFERWATN